MTSSFITPKVSNNKSIPLEKMSGCKIARKSWKTSGKWTSFSSIFTLPL